MKCTYFLQSQCRSCSNLEKNYSDTLQEKEIHLKNLFNGLSIPLLPTVAISEVAGSRNKAKFAVFSVQNQVCFGLTEADGRQLELEHCPLHAEGINELLPSLKKVIENFRIIPYDLKKKKGELKYLIISKSNKSDQDEFMIRFVLRSKESIDRLKKAIPEILNLNPAVKVVTANIQPVHSAILEGDEEIVLSTQQMILHQFDEISLYLGARSFFQVTPVIAKELYNAVSKKLTEDRPRTLLDLYCGVGAFSFFAKRTVEKVSGVEISKEAIDCALASAALNHKDIQFSAEDAEIFLKAQGQKFEALVINPPRRGLNKDILGKIKEMAPAYLYYSSCNAVTLRRDFDELAGDYHISSMQIFDMFPYTTHYETLMCLKRKEGFK